MHLITCADVALGYEDRTVAEHLSFTLDPGEYLCILGENGAGKSTLLGALLGLRPVLSGSLTRAPGLERAMGYLPQQTAVQRDFPASVWEIVLSGFLGKSGLRPWYTAEEKRQAMEHLERMGAVGLKNRCYRELSGGQQQRVLLARALCAAETLLLLDEPTAGLDPQATEELYRLVAERNRAGMAVVMISHDPENVLPYASHVLHIGRNPFYGTVDAYRQSPQGRAFLRRNGGEA